MFGYEQDETKPLYPLSITKPQPDGVRYSLLVYELKDQPLFNGQVDEDDGVVGDKWEIAKRIAKWKYPRRKAKAKNNPSYKPDDLRFHYARKAIARKLRKTDPAEFRKQKRTLQTRVGRYMRAAEKHLDNVCKGQFP